MRTDCRVFCSAILMKVEMSKHPTCLQCLPRPGFSIRLDDCGSWSLTVSSSANTPSLLDASALARWIIRARAALASDSRSACDPSELADLRR